MVIKENSRNKWTLQSIILYALLGALIGLASRDLGLFFAIFSIGERAVPCFLVVILIISGGILSPFRIAKMAMLYASVACVLTWLIVAFTPLCSGLIKMVKLQDPIRNVDGVYVLVGGLLKNGELNASSMARLIRGVKLVKDGVAPRLIVGDYGSSNPSFSKAAKKLMHELKIDIPIIVVSPVSNTREEAVRVEDLYKTNGWQSLAIVTSPVHTTRAKGTFENTGLDVICISSSEVRYDLESLEISADRIQAFPSILHEIVGIQVYRYRGWID